MLGFIGSLCTDPLPPGEPLRSYWKKWAPNATCVILKTSRNKVNFLLKFSKGGTGAVYAIPHSMTIFKTVLWQVFLSPTALPLTLSSSFFWSPTAGPPSLSPQTCSHTGSRSSPLLFPASPPVEDSFTWVAPSTSLIHSRQASLSLSDGPCTHHPTQPSSWAYWTDRLSFLPEKHVVSHSQQKPLGDINSHTSGWYTWYQGVLGGPISPSPFPVRSES